ncbi:hypothetical protein [Chryseobacterium koreense]|uniref:Knr4/Smi1-like domain-containing protein n=1 Tax=Chryseobacterium koreense CCUG 49689 TaxID=1304281 RepID=A0A0J7IWV3_9FLAO|nr:hypothetical protein [Chryseobacterium koreense]KMQ70289.1 hypothetical protein ACM44_13245 [Chryseobacterium koreense CCUG 49689]MBB5332599.1 hypothetical protein [Chryseobacterium koreense]
MTLFFDEPLIESLLDARDQQKTIVETKYAFNTILKDDFPELNRLENIHPSIKEFYNEIADGFQLNWKKDENSFGFIQLAEMKHLLAGANGNGIYFNEDLPQDTDIRFFHPLDLPTPETYVGFIIKPDTIYQSVYYLHGDNELSNLDLDFHGYTEMAYEARVFNYWQLVLLEYMNGKNSEITETFKTEMPQIFPDWTWENFIEKFESLRLSNK